MKLLVFGPLTGYASYPVVMRGLIGAFRKLGVDVVAADISGPGGDLDPALVRELSYGRMPPELEVDCIFAMKPSIQMAKLAERASLVGLHVGDVSEIPAEWKLVMQHEDLVVVPSSWCAEVTRRAVPEADVFVANHGIEAAYLEPVSSPSPRSRGRAIKFLHFCSAGVYPERKGTPQALAAFERLVCEGYAVTLTLVVPELRRAHKRLLGAMSPAARERTCVSTRGSGMTAEHMIETYLEHDVLLCPSRAEGFGIQPLEARALGMPVVQTLCTGMADHGLVEETSEEVGVVTVPHGGLTEAWGDFAQAPSVSKENVLLAMRRAVDEFEGLREAAQRHAPEMIRWSWVEQTRGLVEKLEGR